MQRSVNHVAQGQNVEHRQADRSLEGASAAPVTVTIDNGKVAFRDASAYWEANTFEAETRLKEELGAQWQIAVIGPGGVHGCNFACIHHDFGRQAGRTGVGTVMGSKQIKALAVRGTKDIYKHWQPYGTLAGFQNLDGPTMKAKVTEIDKGCTNCAIPCGKYGKGVLGGKTKYQEGPEYESSALLGGNLGIADIQQVAYLNGLCDELGLDSISAGNVVGWTLAGIPTPERLASLGLDFCLQDTGR